MPSFWSSLAEEAWNSRRSKRRPSERLVSSARLTALLHHHSRGEREGRDLFGNLHRFINQLGGRNDARDEAGTLRLLRTDQPAGQAHLHCLRLANELGEPLRAAGAGDACQA